MYSFIYLLGMVQKWYPVLVSNTPITSSTTGNTSASGTPAISGTPGTISATGTLTVENNWSQYFSTEFVRYALRLLYHEP